MRISAVIGPLPKSEHSDWLFDPVLEQQQKYSIPRVSVVIKRSSACRNEATLSTCPYAGPSVRMSVHLFVGL